MIGPAGNSVLFPINLNISCSFTLGEFEGLRETNLSVSFGANHEVLNIMKHLKNISVNTTESETKVCKGITSESVVCT